MRRRLLGLALLAFLLAAGRAQAQIVLSEVAAQNQAIVLDSFGAASDYVELYNDGSEPASLAGLYLSDRAGTAKRSALPGVTLAPGEYRVIFASGKEYVTEAGEIHVGFRLSAEGEQVFLTDEAGAEISSVAFGALGADEAFARIDGVWRRTYLPTPGAENRAVTLEELGAALAEQNPLGVRLNEICASRSIFKTGNSYDYIELYNAGKKRVTLAGMTLSLGLSGEKSYTFPKGASIKAGGYALVYCTTDTGKKNSAATYYAPFKIPASGATVLLRDAQGAVLDRVTLGQQYGNVSYGRAQGGTRFGFLETMTPGKENGTAVYPARQENVTFETPGGYYTGGVTVRLCAAAGAQIRYTTDGSVPTEKSTRYERPLAFSETTVVRARAFGGGLLASDTTAATYLVDVAYDTPVISLIAEDDYLFSNSMGILVNGSGEKRNWSYNWEYPGNAEYFDVGGETLINQQVTFRVSGQVSRQYPQKSIVLFARSALGADTFDFNPFPNRTYTSYKSLVMRGAGTDSHYVRFRDAMITSMAAGMNVMYQDVRVIQVYINGRYWGHFNLREKINKYSIAQWEGVTDEDDIDGLDLLYSNGHVLKGTNEDYYALLAFVKKNDLNVPENLQRVLDWMDVDSYFDHTIIQMITGNQDGNNVKFYRIAGGKWKWILFDLDTALIYQSTRPFRDYMAPLKEKPKYGFQHAPFVALMNVPEMRDKFLTRMGEVLAERFTSANILRLIDEWERTLDPVMQNHCERWGFLKYNNWKQNISDLRASASARPMTTVNTLAAGFDLTEEEIQKYFGAFLAAEATAAAP